MKRPTWARNGSPVRRLAYLLAYLNLLPLLGLPYLPHVSAIFTATRNVAPPFSYPLYISRGGRTGRVALAFSTTCERPTFARVVGHLGQQWSLSPDGRLTARDVTGSLAGVTCEAPNPMGILSTGRTL